MIPLIVFAKIPIPGLAKTRIAAVCGTGQADRIYRELLTATARNVAGFSHHVAYTGGDDPAELRDFFPLAASFFPQHGDDLGKRMAEAMRIFFRQNYQAVIIIGCDCPALTADLLTTAIRHLQQGAEVVIAPALDGGYTLIGCTPKTLAVFSAKSWSKPELFSETIAIIEANNYRLALLPPVPDIDTLDDYTRWNK
jgi:rSAM/selenodomain-associated transferase 1